MTDIPHSVLSEHFQERMKGRRLVAAVLLTYQFDPGFFEQEVLPVLLDVPLSHAVAIRLVQLEDALRGLAGQIAVYYDANGLLSGDAGSAKLDVRRIPVQHGTGIFHPKNLFLLTEQEDADEYGVRPQTLICASLSANLTRSGWWENVEVCHVEEIAAGEKTRLKDEFIRFLKSVQRATPAEGEHAALQEVLRFLRGTEQRAQRSVDGRLCTHFYYGRESLVDFLDQIAGEWLRGAYLEIISPYFDDAAQCKPLLDLTERFEPREVRISLPRAMSGEVLCNKKLYQSVREMPRVCWGHLPGDLVRLGRSEDAGERFVHAKVYRFFTQSPKREIYFLGSPNLTNAAHQSGGNVESGFLVDLIPPRRPDFWLTPDDRKATDFRAVAENEGTAASGGTQLNLRFHWDRRLAEAYWDSPNDSPELRLEARGVVLGDIGPLTPRVWTVLGERLAVALERILAEVSFVYVHCAGEEPALLLVQEEGMSHKPSLLLNLSAADILRYWSLLTPEQRAAFIESRAPESALLDQGADLVARAKLALEHTTLFDRFAGFFHAFSCLERSVRAALDADPRREREAMYRLFGKKYDSLGNLLDRVLSRDDVGDDVDKYVLVLCARQLCQVIRSDYSEFWNAHRADGRALVDRFATADSIRSRLIERDPSKLESFLDWFDRWFLSRAQRVEAEA